MKRERGTSQDKKNEGDEREVPSESAKCARRKSFGSSDEGTPA